MNWATKRWYDHQIGARFPATKNEVLKRQTRKTILVYSCTVPSFLHSCEQLAVNASTKTAVGFHRLIWFGGPKVQIKWFRSHGHWGATWRPKVPRIRPRRQLRRLKNPRNLLPPSPPCRPLGTGWGSGWADGVDILFQGSTEKLSLCHAFDR